jgi:ABC-type branched-subunit amino acid transport system substrate-binding protein
MQQRMGITTWGKRLLAFLAAGALVLAACGSSKGSGATPSSATTASAAPAATTTAGATPSSVATTAGSATTAGAAAPASGDPVTIMTIGPTDAPQFSLPSIPVGAEIAVDEINKAGGIGGRPAKLVTCNDKNDPNVAAACVRQAIDAKAVAIVGGLSLFDTAIVPLLKSAGIPWIGLVSSSVFSAENVFLFTDGATAFTAIGGSLVTQGCKNVAVLLSASAGPTNGAQIAAGVLAGGGKVAATLNAPATGADWAPTVAKARDAGADCIGAGTGPPETGPLIAAIKAGAPLKLATADGGLPEVVLKQIGAPADGTIAVSPFLPKSATTGIVQDLAKKIAAKAPNVSMDTFAMVGYTSVLMLQAAMKGQTDVSAATVTKALAGLTNFDTGLGPVVNFSKPNPVVGYERIFNTKAFLWVAKGGSFELLQPNPIDMSAALKALSEKK